MEHNATDYFSGEWIREANRNEQIHVMSHKHGCLQIWHQLHLKCKVPLQDAHVKATLTHIYRKVPNLNTAFSYRNGKLWMKKASNPNVDFKTLQKTSLEEVRYLLRNYQYSEETGPLFCGILLKDCPDENIDPEDLNPDMEHSYYMCFGYHHSIVDGTSLVLIDRFFITILNDVIDGKPIDNEPLGTFAIKDETTKLLAHAKEAIKANSKLREKLSYENILAGGTVPCLRLGFKAPGGERRTATLEKILDTNTTSTFVRKCKLENLSVNSAFTALAHVVLVDILIENSYLKDTYVIQSIHVVDFRRYWSKQVPVQDALGCHVSQMKILTNTPKITEDQFWDYARSLHRTVHSNIASRRTIFERAFQEMQSDGSPITDEYVLSDKPINCDFLISSMGDITDLITEGGEHVKINHILAGAAIPLLEEPMDIYINTFRGKLRISFDYNVHAVDKVIVENFLSKILERIYFINDEYSSSKL